MSENDQYFNSICDVTEIKTKVFIYTWKIINFKYISVDYSLEDFLITAPENIQDENNKLWNVDLFTDPTNTYLRADVIFCATGEQFCKTYFLSICIIDVNGKDCEIYKSNSAEIGVEIEIENFIKRDFLLDDKNGLVPNGDLTLRFKAYVTDPLIHHPRLAHPISQSNNTCFEFDSILNKEKFSDVKIRVSDKVFHVYKGILAVRSPVFAAMFEHNMKENIDNVVEIEDVDYEIMQEILRFIYTGKVSNIEDIASDLLVAADKYQIEELKMLCEERLINNLNVENVTSLLIHAEKYKSKNLKAMALKFFKFHAKEVIKTENYKADLNSLLPLLSDVVEILV